MSSALPVVQDGMSMCLEGNYLYDEKYVQQMGSTEWGGSERGDVCIKQSCPQLIEIH